MKHIKNILIAIVMTSTLFSTTAYAKTTVGKCVKVASLKSAEFWAEQYGESVQWIYARGFMIKVWQRPSSQGKGRAVGKMYPGSNAVIITESQDDYKVKSPFDKSVGWINKMQVQKTKYINSKSHKPCKP